MELIKGKEKKTNPWVIFPCPSWPCWALPLRAGPLTHSHAGALGSNDARAPRVSQSSAKPRVLVVMAAGAWSPLSEPPTLAHAPESFDTAALFRCNAGPTHQLRYLPRDKRHHRRKREGVAALREHQRSSPV